MQSNDLPVSPEIVHLPLDQLREAPWNPNQMDPPLLAKLERSVERFGLTGVLVVRPMGDDLYQVLSGNQRYQVLRKLKWKSAPCVIVEIGDAEAKLLAQTLNRLHGSDDLGLRANLVKDILTAIPTEEVLALLPETSQGLGALTMLNQETLEERLRQWQLAQKAKLVRFSARLTPEQLETVERALNRLLPEARDSSAENPNTKGNALYLMALEFLNREDK